MKKTLVTMLTLFLMTGCTTESGNPEDIPSSIHTAEGTPIRLVYERMWEYSAHGESEDTEYIRKVLEAIESLKTGAETQIMTEDYTDIIRIYYEGDLSDCFEFEENNLVDGGKRYRVEGNLSGLRKLLEECLEEEQ